MSDEEKVVRLRCERIQADVPNLNNRVYTREHLQKMVDRANQEGPKRRLLGKLGQDDVRVTMSNASHLVLSGRLDGDHVSAEIEPLDTPMGRVLEDLLASGEAEIVPCGVGSLREDGVVGEDYRFISFDVVQKLTEKEIAEVRARGKE